MSEHEVDDPEAVDEHKLEVETDSSPDEDEEMFDHFDAKIENNEAEQQVTTDSGPNQPILDR